MLRHQLLNNNSNNTPNTFSLHLKNAVLCIDEVCLKGLKHISAKDEWMKVMNTDIVKWLKVMTLRLRRDRGEASTRRGEAEAALLFSSKLLRGEASASRHTSLIIILSLKRTPYPIRMHVFISRMTAFMKQATHSQLIVRTDWLHERRLSKLQWRTNVLIEY